MSGERDTASNSRESSDVSQWSGQARFIVGYRLSREMIQPPCLDVLFELSVPEIVEKLAVPPVELGLLRVRQLLNICFDLFDCCIHKLNCKHTR